MEAPSPTYRGNRHFWYFMLNGAVLGLASTMLSPFLPVFLYKQLSISTGAVSILYFVSGILGTITVLLMGWLVDRVGRRKIYAFGSSNAAISVSLAILFKRKRPTKSRDEAL